MLAHAHGVAWVWLAVRDLVCRTSYSTCSSVRWAALICSACASITAWSSETKACKPLHRCFPSSSRAAISCSSLDFLTAVAAAVAGRGRKGGLGASCRSFFSHPKNFIYTNPAQPRRVINYIFSCLLQSTRRAENGIYAGLFEKGTVFCQFKCASNSSA